MNHFYFRILRYLLPFGQRWSQHRFLYIDYNATRQAGQSTAQA